MGRLSWVWTTVLVLCSLTTPLSVGVASTPPGVVAQERVEYAGFMKLGGMDQWVTIRGNDPGNPVLLVVHGGPGDPLSPYIPQFEPYEHDFVVVQWDQRGAGRTFGRNGADTPHANLAQVARDGAELAEHMTARFGQRKVIVIGHSWGSVVAMAMVQLRPELFSAYVGTGQVSSASAIREAQTAFVRAVAEVRGDRELLAALETIATLNPTDPETIYANLPLLLSFNRALRSHLNPSDSLWLGGLAQRLDQLSSPEEIRQANEGMNFSGGAYLRDTLTEDLFATASSVDVPLYVIQGKDDLFTPTAPAMAWFDRVTAPAKRRWLIEDAGHFALVTHQEEVLAALKEIRGSTTVQ